MKTQSLFGIFGRSFLRPSQVESWKNGTCTVHDPVKGLYHPGSPNLQSPFFIGWFTNPNLFIVRVYSSSRRNHHFFKWWQRLPGSWNFKLVFVLFPSTCNQRKEQISRLPSHHFYFWRSTPPNQHRNFTPNQGVIKYYLEINLNPLKPRYISSCPPRQMLTNSYGFQFI